MISTTDINKDGDFEINRFSNSNGVLINNSTDKVLSRNGEMNPPVMISPDSFWNGIPYITASDLSHREIPPIIWTVEGFFSVGLSLLGGKPKTGKSFWVLQLALMVAQGMDFLGRKTRQGSVYYFALEDTERRWKDRMEKMLPRDFPHNLVFCGNLLPLPNGGLDELERILQKDKSITHIIIDTYGKVRDPKRRSSHNYNQDYQELSRLKELADQYSITTLLVHHTRKSKAQDPFDEILGSIGITGCTDTNMILCREREQTMAQLHYTGRDIEEDALNLSFDPETCLWEVLESSPLPEMNSNERKIVDLLMNRGGLRSGEIEQALQETDRMNPSTVRSLLKRMKEKEILYHDQGQYQLFDAIKQILSESADNNDLLHDQPTQITEECKQQEQQTQQDDFTVTNCTNEQIIINSSKGKETQSMEHSNDSTN